MNWAGGEDPQFCFLFPALHFSLLTAGALRPDQGRLSLSPGGEGGFNFSFFCFLSAVLTSVRLLCPLELSSYHPSPHILQQREEKTIPLKRRWVKEKATLNNEPVLNLGLLLFVRGLKIPWAIFCFCTFLPSYLPHFQAAPRKGTSFDSLTPAKSFDIIL